MTRSFSPGHTQLTALLTEPEPLRAPAPHPHPFSEQADSSGHRRQEGRAPSRLALPELPWRPGGIPRLGGASSSLALHSPLPALLSSSVAGMTEGTSDVGYMQDL